MLTRTIEGFLRRTHPFTQLDDRAIAQLAGRLTLELYPSGTVILKQGDRSSGALYIIKEGSVRISAGTADGGETVIDFRGVGDTFGSFPIEADRPIEISARAESDTVCYVADRASMVKLLEEHPGLSEFLIPVYIPKGGVRGRRLPPVPETAHDRSENALFTTPVRELADRDVVSASADITILEAARLMSARRTDVLVIMDESENAVGIVTTADLRDRALVPQKSLSDHVGDIMSRSIVRIDGADLCFEALLKMLSHDVHHLLVIASGRAVGIVSSHDFMTLQVISPLMIVRDIENQSTVEGLAISSRKVSALTSMLVREGARAASINRIITNVNDRIERKILDLLATTLGPAPVPYCWIVYGSAGRMEQTFITDQDNGLIYSDPQSEEEAREARDYFTRFASFAVNAFAHCGFELCPGEFMATNPTWCQPFSVWRNYFSNWKGTPALVPTHYSAMVFDFRGIHGDLQLATDLKKHRTYTPRDLKAVADMTMDSRPPLGLFGALPLETDGVHANQLDLKKYCLTPLINIIRLFSFESNLDVTATADRLAALQMVHPVMKTAGHDLSYALEFLSMLRIRHQLDQVNAGLDPDNFINPKKLSSLEQRNLKEICRLLSRIIDDIEKKYSIGTQL